MKQRYSALALLIAFSASPALATNGMNLDAYGPVSGGLGGASLAFDNGTAAAMNNPATLALMPEGKRFDIGALFLGPSLNSTAGGLSAQSSAKSFFMPQLGFSYKANNLTLGAAVLPSGGMGAEYAADSFVAAGSGEVVRSEIAVMRFMVPVAYNLTPDLAIGATADYVRGGMDVKMAMTSAQFMDMVAGPPFNGTQAYGSLAGSIIDGFVAAMGGGQITGMNWGRFDFSDTSALTQAASGSGFSGKIGLVYNVMPGLKLGATYHPKTSLGDLSASGATLSMNVTGPACGGAADCTIPMTGELKVKDFKWPDTVGFGVAYDVSSDWMIAADYKMIRWSGTMAAFNMGFVADATQSNPGAAGFAGKTLDATLKQNWKDQNTFALGTSYRLNELFTVRGGLNLANNPIPDQMVNPLFPAVISTAYHLGVGYQLNANSGLDFSFDLAPSLSATNGAGVVSTLGGLGSQIAYNVRF